MIQVTHHPTLEITGFRTDEEDTETPSSVPHWCGRRGVCVCNTWMSQLATRSRKMRAGKTRQTLYPFIYSI